DQNLSRLMPTISVVQDSQLLYQAFPLVYSSMSLIICRNPAAFDSQEAPGKLALLVKHPGAPSPFCLLREHKQDHRQTINGNEDRAVWSLGILFFEKMTDEELDKIRDGLQGLETKYEKSTGLPRPEKIETRKRSKTGVGFGKS
ncbi:hypothetical protein SOVF_045370 isoform B, partial [Spinacia oleracea]